MAGRELRSRHDDRGEAQGADSACETRTRDEFTHESSVGPDARQRTPGAGPVEAAGAATEAEHASESERGDGVATNAIKLLGSP